MKPLTDLCYFVTYDEFTKQLCFEKETAYNEQLTFLSSKESEDKLWAKPIARFLVFYTTKSSIVHRYYYRVFAQHEVQYSNCATPTFRAVFSVYFSVDKNQKLDTKNSDTITTIAQLIEEKINKPT